MSREQFDQALRGFLEKRPFQPFRVAMKEGPAFTVDDPEAVPFCNGAAAFIGVDNVFFFDFQNIQAIQGMNIS